jgi:multidrug efflux pump subunit AcrA (membrane-fusion protein)
MKKWGFTLLPVLVLLLLLTGCGQQAVEEVEPDPVPVRMEKVVTGSVSETVSFSGEVTAGSEVQVVPKTAGRIARVAAQVGLEVKKGDLLVELEAQELAVALKQAEATVEMARANLRNAETGGLGAQLRAGVQQAEANFNNAESTLHRMEMLYQEGAIALQQLEGVRLQHQVARSQYELARQQMDLFEQGKGQVEILQAQLKQAEAGAEMARLTYGNARITAPVDGVVAMVSAEVGNMASPAMPVVALVNMEGVMVEAKLTEQTVGLVKPGMIVRVEVPSLGDEDISGEVKEVAPSPLAGTKSYTVKVLISGGTQWKPGMFARLKLAVATSEDTVLVPLTALLEREGQYFAFTIKDGKAVRREVTLGLQDGRFAEILSGFTAGEMVVAVGQQFLSEGTPVLAEEGDSL